MFSSKIAKYKKKTKCRHFENVLMLLVIYEQHNWNYNYSPPDTDRYT